MVSLPRGLMLGLAVSLAAVAIQVQGVAKAQDAAPKRLRGTIDTIDGATLTIRPAAGDTFRLHLADGARIVEAVPASLADIKPGGYVGIANESGADGRPVAVEVHIFPDAMRGVGEGKRAWDLGKTSRMTNGAVGTKVTGIDGDTLAITYKGGASTIQVTPKTQIMRLAPGTPADLKPGAHVFIREAKPGQDGTLQTASIVVGKDGFAPAM